VSVLAALSWVVLAAALLPLILIVMNLFALRRLPPGRSTSLVSVLIPARNEAANIDAAIASALASRHDGLEVLVLDDDSDDGTAAAVRRWTERDRRVRLLRGRRHDPRLWGKPQACAELAAAAAGDTLLFMDADVRLEPDGIARIAAALGRSPAALLSGIPGQQTQGLAEKLIVPLIHFVLLGFLPVAAMRRSPRSAYGVACGQLLAVRRDAYVAAGGHRRVAAQIHDGMALARSLREAGYLTDLADFTDIASCRMYRSPSAVISGFAKNAHEGLGSPRGIVPWSLLLFGGQCAWLALLPAALGGSVPVWPLALAAASACLGRLLLDLRFRHPRLGFILHPVGVVALLAIQWYALARRAAGRPVAWKDRAPPTDTRAGRPARPIP